MKYKIFPLSENALTVDFGNEISENLNEIVIQLNEIVQKNPFIGFIETVPAYSSLTVFFDLAKVRNTYRKFPNAYSALKDIIENALNKISESKKESPRLIKIPVNYSVEVAPDLEFVAKNANLSIEEVIKIHTEKTYRVFMIGFLPAFAYMGEVDQSISCPRKETPRLKIEKGSVGIAGKQTGIYPLESPGGWQIIGKTDLELFQPESGEVSLLKTGDLVQFFDINQK